jgi:hypothetical protein
MFASVSTARVLITASLALNPVINAVEMRQSPNPKGVNTQAINFPKNARSEDALFSV